MNKKFLSLLVCTAVLSQTAIISPTKAAADSSILGVAENEENTNDVEAATDETDVSSTTKAGASIIDNSKTIDNTANVFNDTMLLDDTTSGLEQSYQNTDLNVSPSIIVDENYSGNDGEELDGIPTYKTIKAAVSSISIENKSEKIIYVKNGIYDEKVTINSPYVTLIGESMDNTIITHGAANPIEILPEDESDPDLQGRTTYGTSFSATVTIKSTANNFKASNITFKNSFDESTTTADNKSAVALKCEADESTFVNCNILGNQDTLFANSGKQYYYKCYIEGDVDFIFGGGQAVFENCEIHSVDRKGISPKGYIAAPSTYEADKYGFLILNSNLTSDDDINGDVYLGRPWHPSSAKESVKSSVVYKNCDLGAHIASDGWSTMKNSGALCYPEDNFMYEYKNEGKGANTTNSNRKQLTDNKANEYSKSNILNGWNFSDSANELLFYLGESEEVPDMESDIVSDESSNNTTDSSTNLAEEVNWNFTEFGAKTSQTDNTISVDKENKTITLTSGTQDGSNTGGKITGSQDGISYYYTVIDPSKNFDICADVKVNFFEKPSPDNQCGFGIMARDTIGVDDDDSTTYSNMALVGGYRAAVQSVFRNNVIDSTGLGAKMEGEHKFYDRPTNDGTATYKLRLRKTNTGYVASVDDGEEVTYYRPKQLEVQDPNHIYLGFFTARVASITVSNIKLTESDVATDPAGEKEPEQAVTPAINTTSSSSTGLSSYDLKLLANTEGTVTVSENGSQIYNDKIEANTTLAIPSTLNEGENTFYVSYLPKDSSTPITQNYTVSYKHYGDENGNVYVSQDGTEKGDGTLNNPIDIYTAVKYAGNGQTIKVKGGTYNLTKPITIAKDNSGTADKVKTFTSHDGERAIFDFGKKSAGLTVLGDYWKVYGIDVCNTSDTQHGITISGNNNIIENVKTYRNGDTGLQISGDLDDTIENWPSNNLILNCESYDNMDAAMNNADGFAAKISVGYGNVFRGCVSHNNTDDGWDLYTKSEHGKIGPVLLENCIAYNNGNLTNGTVTKGDGNGFKLGGEGISVANTLKNSLSFNNNADGITNNSNPGINVYNSISVDNKDNNFDLHPYTGATITFDLKNNISFRAEKGAADADIDPVVSDNNYFYDGDKTSNKSGAEITSEYFKSVKMPSKIEIDSNGNIIWPDYMNPVNGEFTHSTGGTTDDGTTDGTSTDTTTGSRSSHHHSSSSSSNKTTTSTNSTLDTITTSSETNKTDDLINKYGNVIKLNQLSKEDIKIIREKVISKISSFIGKEVQVGEDKTLKTTEGNEITQTVLSKDGKNEGLVITVNTIVDSTIKIDLNELQKVTSIYKYIPSLDKYIDVTNTGSIAKNTVTIPVEENEIYVLGTKDLSINDKVNDGWTKVNNNWYMINKTGNILTGWQQDGKEWSYLSETNGQMQTGWIKDGDNWYLIKDNGYMITGWAKVGDAWYYLKDNGQMATGWIKNGYNWYYMNSDGYMASNIEVDGYILDSDGALI